MFMFKFASNPTIHTGDTCTSFVVKTLFFDLMLSWKWGHGQQNLISLLQSLSNIYVQAWFKSIHLFKRYDADKLFFSKSVDLLWP